MIETRGLARSCGSVVALEAITRPGFSPSRDSIPRAWPFARPRGSPADDSVIILAVAITPISASLAMWQILACEQWWPARILTALLLAAMLVAAHRDLARRLRARGLSLELAERPAS